MTKEKIYLFSNAIEKDLEILESYFRKRKYAKETISQYRNYAGLFLQWLERNNATAETVNYTLLKNFIFQLKEEKSIGQTNRILIAINHYYKSLDLGINPASGMRLRGMDRNFKNYFVEYETLEQLYKLYGTIDNAKRRNKVMLGLMIYQGVTSGELHQLKPSHIDLNETKILIPGSKNSNRRILKLEANQLLELQAYVKEIRPQMLADIESEKVKEQPGRKPKQIDPKIYEQLFFSRGGGANVKSSLHNMFRAIQKVYPKITSTKVIRSTVISHWLRHYDVRKVQYMSGHRYVSSTERYNAFNLQDLEESLNNYHPLK